MESFLRRTDARILTRYDHPGVAELERRLVNALDHGRAIINYESRWLVDALAERDPTGVSPALLERVNQVKTLTEDDYAALLTWRRELRAHYDTVLTEAAGVVTLSAPGPAPTGLSSTGDAALTVPASLLGVPAVSLPAFAVDGLPVGLQLLGARHRDEHLFALARWAETLIRP